MPSRACSFTLTQDTTCPVPISPITLQVSGTDVDRVRIDFYRTDLLSQLKPSDVRLLSAWLIDPQKPQTPPVLTREVTIPEKLSVPRRVSVDALPAGTYVVEASAGEVRTRTLVMVTGLMLVARAVGSQILVYTCNALDGSPIADAELRVLAVRSVGGRMETTQVELRTNEQGVALIDRKAHNLASIIGIIATAGDWQAYLTEQHLQPTVTLYLYDRDTETGAWRFYLFTDLPIYQPGQTVNWRLIARLWKNDRYQTPANRTLCYALTNSRGRKLHEAEARLNAFGSLSGAVEIPQSVSEGVLFLKLYNEAGRYIDQLLLCHVGRVRQQELRLTAEAQVIPQSAEGVNGQQRADAVEVLVNASDMSGRALQGAKVSVYLFTSWSNSKEPGVYDLPWYYDGLLRRTLANTPVVASLRGTAEATTDASGTAKVRFDDIERDSRVPKYLVWVTAETSDGRRVTARAEVTGREGPSFASLVPARRVYAPGETVTVRLQTQDVQGNPTQMRGTLRVQRVVRTEPQWRTPWGSTATDEETLRNLRELGVPLEKDNTYTEYEQVLTQPLHTDANGRSEAQFALSEEGCYEVVWESEDTSPARRAVDTSYLKVVKPGSPEPTFFREVQGPVRVHPDAADLKPGQELPVRIILQDAPCYVLVLEETDKILRWRLLSAKYQTEAIRIPLTEEHTPAFRLTAITVKDGLAFGDQWEVIVPPVQHNLLIDIQPGRGGSYTIRTHDYRGNPVPADVCVVVVNRAALSHALRFPDPEFDRSRGPTEDPFAPMPPLPPGYPEDPRLHFPPPVQIEQGKFATSYDTGHYIKERRGYQMLPIRYNWRGEFINRYLTTLPPGHIGSAPSMPAKIIADGRIQGAVSEWSYTSPVRGPWQFREVNTRNFRTPAMSSS